MKKKKKKTSRKSIKRHQNTTVWVQQTFLSLSLLLLLLLLLFYAKLNKLHTFDSAQQQKTERKCEILSAFSCSISINIFIYLYLVKPSARLWFTISYFLYALTSFWLLPLLCVSLATWQIKIYICEKSEFDVKKRRFFPIKLIGALWCVQD